jgi:hypothetical protein
VQARALDRLEVVMRHLASLPPGLPPGTALAASSVGVAAPQPVVWGRLDSIWTGEKTYVPVDPGHAADAEKLRRRYGDIQADLFLARGIAVGNITRVAFVCTYLVKGERRSYRREEQLWRNSFYGGLCAGLRSNGNTYYPWPISSETLDGWGTRVDGPSCGDAWYCQRAPR